MTGNRTDGDLNVVPDPAHRASQAPVPRNGEMARDPKIGSSGASSGAIPPFSIFPAANQPYGHRTSFLPDTGSPFPCSLWAGIFEVKSALNELLNVLPASVLSRNILLGAGLIVPMALT